LNSKHSEAAPGRRGRDRRPTAGRWTWS